MSDQTPDYRQPLSEDEIEFLLKATLHGGLPFKTQSRLIATVVALREQFRPSMGPKEAQLDWKDGGGFLEAVIGDFVGGKGARFSITEHPTCNRRGQYRLLVEVSESWGCFDHQDQPMRWYHRRPVALLEAQLIANAIYPTGDA